MICLFCTAVGTLFLLSEPFDMSNDPRMMEFDDAVFVGNSFKQWLQISENLFHKTLMGVEAE